MPFYRKKPVVVEAHQWHKHGDHPMVKKLSNEVVDPLPDWTKQDLDDLIIGGAAPDSIGIIATLEGAHVVRAGDYIVRGIVGEHYPVKERIFLETYERVDDDEATNRGSEATPA